jgi:serine/threonine-protein kinase
MADAKLTDLEAGEVLNNTYRLDALIGQGGMGRVFSATDLKLERKVAVKALHASNLDTETMRRFDRETQVMGQLDHPSVVTLFSFGRTRGVPWLAMRFLEGQDLWAALASHGGRMTPQALLPIVRQILPALGYLHGRGLLHRDLKPSNIHIGKSGKVTLCDFGLARGHQSTLTRTGVVWGTPEYMAPEQILGERELDGRADLYAVGVVMYRMLAGQPVFDDKDDHDVLRSHLTRPRPDVSRVVPSLSPMVGAALQKALAIHAEDRFQSAAEMLAALELVLALPLAGQAKPEPPRASPVPPRVEGTKPVPKVREADATTPAAPSVTLDDGEEESDQATRPHGFSALPPLQDDEPSDNVTSREGFSAVSGTPTPPLEGQKVTQPNDAISGSTTPDRPAAKRPPAPAPDSVESVPFYKEERTNVQPAFTPRSAVPLPVFILGAVALFLLGLIVAKLLL